jgi:hypothetical protein
LRLKLVGRFRIPIFDSGRMDSTCCYHGSSPGSKGPPPSVTNTEGGAPSCTTFAPTRSSASPFAEHTESWLCRPLGEVGRVAVGGLRAPGHCCTTGPPLGVTPLEPPYYPSRRNSSGLQGRGGWGREQPWLALVPSWVPSRAMSDSWLLRRRIVPGGFRMSFRY